MLFAAGLGVGFLLGIVAVICWYAWRGPFGDDEYESYVAWRKRYSPHREQ